MTKTDTIHEGIVSSFVQDVDCYFLKVDERDCQEVRRLLDMCSCEDGVPVKGDHGWILASDGARARVRVLFSEMDDCLRVLQLDTGEVSDGIRKVFPLSECAAQEGQLVLPFRLENGQDLAPGSRAKIHLQGLLENEGVFVANLVTDSQPNGQYRQEKDECGEIQTITSSCSMD